MFRIVTNQLLNKINQVPKGAASGGAQYASASKSEDIKYEHNDRIIQAMENRHLYYLIGGGIAFWVVAPVLKHSYDNYSEKKEKKTILADIQQLKIDVDNIKKRLEE
jgi:hypothetical protein